MNAHVVAGVPDADGNVEITSKYSWNGAMSLPDTSEDARDDNGDKLVVSGVINSDGEETSYGNAEYTLKMRIVNRRITYEDGSEKVERVPILVWSLIN